MRVKLIGVIVVAAVAVSFCLTCLFVVNRAAGKSPGAISMTEIDEHLGHCAREAERVIAALAGA